VLSLPNSTFYSTFYAHYDNAVMFVSFQEGYMAKENRRAESFGRWLKNYRKNVKRMTQAEAVARMPQEQAVAVDTWSRWEKGHRMPPRTKVDAIAIALGVDAKAISSRTGRVVADRQKQTKNPQSLTDKLVNAISPEDSLTDMMSQFITLVDEHRGKVTPYQERQQWLELAYAYSKILKLGPAQRIATMEQIRQLFERAKDRPVDVLDSERAIMRFPRVFAYPLVPGIRVRIEYASVGGSDLIYTVKKVKMRGTRCVAYLTC
jgi:transcriptional regulator with XRE-family HTH domain